MLVRADGGLGALPHLVPADTSSMSVCPVCPTKTTTTPVILGSILALWCCCICVVLFNLGNHASLILIVSTVCDW